MKTVFVAIIMIFEAQTGQPLDMATAAFESGEMCKASVEQVRQRAAADMMIHVEGKCLEVALVPAQ